MSWCRILRHSSSAAASPPSNATESPAFAEEAEAGQGRTSKRRGRRCPQKGRPQKQTESVPLRRFNDFALGGDVGQNLRCCVFPDKFQHLLSVEVSTLIRHCVPLRWWWWWPKFSAEHRRRFRFFPRKAGCYGLGLALRTEPWCWTQSTDLLPTRSGIGRDASLSRLLELEDPAPLRRRSVKAAPVVTLL